MKEVKRPWGNFKQFALNKKCTVKLLTLNPHQELSLQSHRHREESWYFLDSASAQVGSKKFRVKEGDFVHVKKNQKHRIIAGNKKVELIEIATGSFRENDEKRYEDEYGRV
ncbi:MAG: phosphomannose isomerase type II C-terminal cupin domain [Nanoarchaeota archaeon]|nr:phosphomannose isomerase type II C-terminal cupin domain [Nanoarchaeota archaeon]